MASNIAQPVLILKSGTERTVGRAAQSSNIMAARAIASAVRTTLGPKGRDKMIVDSAGLVVITNDGATILDEIKVKHPAAKMMVEVAKTQEEEVGDGTTAAVVFAGELLEKAEALIEEEVHPSTIVKGYQLAAEKAKEILEELSFESEESFVRVAATAMTGKGVSNVDRLSELVVEAIKAVVREENGKKKVNFKDVTVEKRIEGSIGDTTLVRGVVLDKTKTHQSMPSRVEGAKIALLTAPIEVRKAELKSELSLSSASQMKFFLEEEERMIKELVDKVVRSGANAIFCQKGIDDLARHYLAKAGIFATHRVKKGDLEKLKRATGARIVTSLDDLKESDLGEAGLVEEVKIGGSEMIFIRDCKYPICASIILRGGTEHVVNSLERAVKDALRVTAIMIEDKRMLAGGGACETELALQLRNYANTLKGREQLAVEKFAEAMEVVPRTLAENAGLDAIDLLVELRSSHEKGDKNAGLNVFAGKVEDMKTAGVVEPLRVKKQALSSGVEAACMILRIDDVIASKEEKEGKKKPEPIED